MKKIYLLLLTFLLSTSLWAEEAPQVNAVATDTPTTAVAQSKETPEVLKWLDRNADQPYLTLLSEYTTTVKEDWSYEETYHARVKIQKEAAKELGQWPIYYNKSRDNLTDIQAHVETADGHIVPATTIQDLPVYEGLVMYSNLKMKVVTLPQVEVGAIIDVTVKSVTSTKEIPHQFWSEILYPAIPTEHANHVFIFPVKKDIQFKSYKTDYKPTIEKTDTQVKYTFSFDQTNPLPEDEELIPPLQEELGGLYFSSMLDWKTVADWYRDLMHKSMVGDPDISLKTIELTKDKTTQKDKAHAILEFIQDNFKFVGLNFGDNMVEPNLSKEIFKNRYGDSKDLNLLIKQMLKVAGIDSNICLFSPEFAGNPQAGLPNPSVFNHVILQMNLDGQSYFVDPLLKGFDFGQYPSAYDNAYVLIINETDFKFDNLPIEAGEDRTLSSKADIVVHPDGFASFNVHVKLPLETSQSFKDSWKTSSPEEKDKFFNNLEQNFTKGGKMIEKKVTGIENRYGHVEFDLKYEAPTAYPLVNDMILIKEEDQSDIPTFTQENRTYPIFVPNNSVIKNENIYHIPEGFKLNFTPPNYTLTSPLLDVAVNYLQKDNTIEVDSTYQTKRALVPVSGYSEVKNFRTELAKKNDQYILFKKTTDLSPEAKDWVKKQ